MKATCILACFAFLACASASLARDEMVILTGSYIKHDVKRYGRVTTGGSQVIVIDRAAIERSGAKDLKDLLFRYGLSR